MTSPSWLDLAGLHRYLMAAGVPVEGPLVAELVTGGRSNVTVRISDGRSSWALRRPPLAGLTASAHDMRREYRVQQALAGGPVPVPATVHYCEDAAIVGAQFGLVEWVDGVVIRDRADLAVVSGPDLDRATESLVEKLVALHGIDVASVGMADFGRPEGFLARQINLWGRQWEAVSTRDLPDLDRLRRRLADAVPTSPPPALIHGDYRIDNAILDRGDPAKVLAVLDWELSTIGDPLTDVAMMCVYRNRALDLILGASAAWSSPRLPSPDALADMYSRRASRDLQNWPFYLGLAHLKLAVIAEGIAHRAQAGADAGRGALRAAEAVPVLVASGLRALRAGTSRLEHNTRRSGRATSGSPRLVSVSGERSGKPKRTVNRERDKRLPELIDAATRVFFERGYRDASVQEMADQLGILKGSVYHYVSSKEDLLGLVLEAAHEHSMGLAEKVTAMDAPPIDRLHEHFRLHVLWYLHNPEHVTVFFRDWRYLTGERLDLVVEHRRGYDRFLRGLLSECKAAGQVSEEIDEKYISFFLLGALNSAPTWYRRGGRDSAETIARTFADLCVSTVVGTKVLASNDKATSRTRSRRSAV